VLYIVEIYRLEIPKDYQRNKEEFFMLTIAICDDNADQCDIIKYTLENMAEITAPISIRSYTGVKDFMTDWEENLTLDILFLDINLSDGNGILLAKKLRTVNRNMMIIYISAFSEFVFETFETHPFDFLRKPFSASQLLTVFSRAYQQLLEAKTLQIVQKNSSITLHHKDILYVESDNHILHIHGVAQNYRIYGKLQDFAAQCEDCGFTMLQIHQSYLINPAHIVEYHYTHVFMSDNQILNISRKYQKEIQLLYLKEQLK
jgi:DNA-binding LytR/AlgR family response regulator